MTKTSRGFQVFVKPGGAACNLGCRYCYYLEKEDLYSRGATRMPDDLLEDYIVQHISASPDEVVRFSWHGGEPTLLGLEFFRRVVEIQRRHKPEGRVIANGLQTNATLIDEPWGEFLAAEGFSVGVSLDGPREEHDRYRLTRDGRSTFDRTLRGYQILCRHRVATDILCVVHEGNVKRPQEVYRFFKGIGASYISFLPLVVPPDPRPPSFSKPSIPAVGASGPGSVSAEAWGDFLCEVFDEWLAHDIGAVKVQIFEEAARTAFGQEHSLCLFRPECGDIPVIERNGDVYACDHFVDEPHRIGNISENPLVELLESPAQRAFGRAKRESLPRVCRECEVLSMCHGECPRNRFLRAPDGEPGLNYLCAGYRKFFNHCRPWVDEVAAEWRRQARPNAPIVPAPLENPAPPGAAYTAGPDPLEEPSGRPGRNDPCPCGSGLKYKKCCGR